MITYTWNCRTVDVRPTDGDLTNVVYNVHWRLTGTKDEISEVTIGSIAIELDEDATFVNFDDLTNATVTGWVEAALGTDEVTAMKAGLQSAIEEKETPTSVTMTIED